MRLVREDPRNGAEVTRKHVDARLSLGVHLHKRYERAHAEPHGEGDSRP